MKLKRYSSIVKKKKKKHDKIVLLVKKKLNAIKIVISNALIDSHNYLEEIVSVNSMLREYNEMKEGIKNLRTSVKHDI